MFLPIIAAIFPLSDPNDADFHVKWTHSHNDFCDQCLSLRNVLDDIKSQTESSSLSFYSEDQNQDLLYYFGKAKKNILDWKAHILRSVHQDMAKQDALRDMDTSEAIIVMDWATQSQQVRFREKQSEWFGKRGLSGNISSVISKANNQDVEVESFVHLFDSCTQDWFSVASIVEDLLMHLKSKNSSIRSVQFRSDEAGCYPSNNLLVASLRDISERVGIRVQRFDHSEP